MLDREFNEMRLQKERLVDDYKERFQRHRGLEDKLDTARLLALLENHIPGGLSWRQATINTAGFPVQIEGTIVEALSAAGITNGVRLIRALRSAKYRSAARKFAASSGISPQEISHLAASILLVGTKNRALLRDYLEDYSLDPNIMSSI
jgi:hypothetical protein